MIVDDVAQTIRKLTSGLPDVKHLPEDPYRSIVKDDIVINNEMWTCTGLRKIHLETCKTKYLDVLHCVLFPEPRYKLPIFGCDIIANNRIVTAAIVDISPVKGVRGEFYKDIKPISERYMDFDFRKLPEWADIFSPHCKFMRLHKQTEQIMYVQLLEEYLQVYVNAVSKAEKCMDIDATYDRYQDQVYYCTQQKQNKKTEAVLGSWFDPTWAKHYIDNVLFDKPKPFINL